MVIVSMKRYVLRTTHRSGKQKSTCKICNYCSELAYKKSLVNMQANHSRVFFFSMYGVTFHIL